MLSLDLSSRVDATSGDTPGVHVRADRTLTLALPKTGLVASAAGSLLLADLGIPLATYRKAGVTLDSSPFRDEFTVPLRRVERASNSAWRQYRSAITELLDDHAHEYPPGTSPLPEAELDRLAAEVPGWVRDGSRSLTRDFRFGDFGGAFGLVARVSLLAAAEGHHPRIELEWGRAAFTTWTHNAAGLTRNDFILAAKIDRIAGV